MKIYVEKDLRFWRADKTNNFKHISLGFIFIKEVMLRLKFIVDLGNRQNNLTTWSSSADALDMELNNDGNHH